MIRQTVWKIILTVVITFSLIVILQVLLETYWAVNTPEFALLLAIALIILVLVMAIIHRRRSTTLMDKGG